MTDNDGQSLDELREQTEMTDRAHEGEVNFDEGEFVDSIVSELDRIEDGASKTYSARDGNGMALLRALEADADGREMLFDGVEDVLGREVDATDRSELVRLLVRAGIESAAPDLMDALEQAVAEQATSNV